MVIRSRLFAFTIIYIFISCNSTKAIKKPQEIQQLTLLDEYVIPYNLQFDNTNIGGLSGIDYNPKEKEYYLICDERSKKTSARFYTMRIFLSNNKIDTVIFTGVTYLGNKLGKNYPDSLNESPAIPDPEALRYNPAGNGFVWSSEGERIISSNGNVLLNPAITETNKQGIYIDTFQIPELLHIKPTENGPRQNGVFEGLDFADNFKTLFVSVEEPLYEDGPRSSIHDTSGIVRIIKFDMPGKKPVAQYGYILEPVAHEPFPKNAFKLNGISDILYLGNNQLLVIERSFSVGRMDCTIKVFVADISSAENIVA